VRTGEPIMLDIMQFAGDSFVVMRVPLKDERGRVIGGVGFMLFEGLRSLQPLVGKFRQLETRLADVQRSLAEERRVKYTFSSFLGSSPPAMDAKRQGRRAAQAETPVLLLGETGTGKEVLAQAIHSASARAHGPFVHVNVASIPEAMLEAGATAFLSKPFGVQDLQQAARIAVERPRTMAPPVSTVQLARPVGRIA
jgi:transcriptional regulator with PAS, ATPase and Fis domain